MSAGKKTESLSEDSVLDCEYAQDDYGNGIPSQSMVVPGARRDSDMPHCSEPEHLEMDRNQAFLMHELSNALGIVGMAMELFKREVNAIIALEPIVDERATMFKDLMRTLQEGVTQATGICEKEKVRRKASSMPPALDECAENAQMKLERLSLSDVLFAQIKLWRRVLRRDLEIETDMQTDINIYADKALLTQVFTNVWLNAIQSMNSLPERCNLMAVGCKVVNGMCRITIEDNGAGIGKEDAKKLFRRGFTTKASGSGIGLSVCRELCQKMGGSFDLRNGSEMGRGATVIMEFPALEDEKKRPAGKEWKQLDLDFRGAKKSG